MASSKPQDRPPTPTRIKVLFIAINLVLFACLAEVAGYTACKVLTTKLVFYPPDRGDFETYLEIHDPVLGWPAPSRAEEEGRDEVGARRSPAFPDREASPPAVSCYGDSFTWSAEAEDDEAWPEVLSTLIGARVDNFGVGGYGSDQALLRFERNSEQGIDQAPVVVLAHLTENVLRNLNQYRGLIYGSNGGLGFKPRFVLDADGELRLIPLALPAPEDYDAFIHDPSMVLHNETFAIGSAEGPSIARFPYILSAARAFAHPRVRAFFSGQPHYARFYNPSHPAQGAELTAAIMERFWREATAQGRIGVPVIIPTGLDIEYFRKRDAWPYQGLLDDLKRRGVPVLDLGPIVEAETRGADLKEYFALGEVSRHFNARGYKVAAEAIYHHLTDIGAVDPARVDSP